MQQDRQTDYSTLASLQPNQSHELRWREFRNAPRYQGSHLLTLRRPTRMPEASRKYVHGDPVQMVDWKAFARTDQLIVRVQRDEASVRVRVVIDISATMQWPTNAVRKEIQSDAPTKAEVAIRVGLNLAHMHLRIGDFVELWLAPESGLPAKCYKPKSPSDIISQYRHISESQFGRDVIENNFESVRFSDESSDVTYWVGDGLSNADISSVFSVSRRAAMLHLLSSLEVDPSWLQNNRCYFDEGSLKKEFQGQMLLSQNNYKNGLQQWLTAFQERISDQGGMYIPVTDKTPIPQYYKLLGYFE